MRKIKGFSYDDVRDQEVIDHINKQQNGSKYMWDLVRKDMQKKDIRSIIKEEIEKYIKGKNIKEDSDIKIDDITSILRI